MSVYLDHAATTPMLPEVADVVAELQMLVGNPSSLHSSGRRARRVVEESRERIAAALGCRPGEVIFTSGGTESNNLAVKGLFWNRRAADPHRNRVIASQIEHHAVLDPLHWLEVDNGAKVDLAAVDERGSVRLPELVELIERNPADLCLVSVMWANNEVGTVQAMQPIAELCAAHQVPVHTDAVQAVGQIPVDFAASGLDALTFTGHKIGGPLGLGALIARRELELTALVHGGGQEREIRSGTLNPPAIAGLALAVELSVATQAESGQRIQLLRDRLVGGLTQAVPDAIINGAPDSCLPGIVHAKFPGCEGDSLMMLLDAQGIECSTGSACDAGVAQPSHVLLAMGSSEDEARSSLRFSLGRSTTEADVDALLGVIGPVVARAKAAGMGARF